MRSESKRLLNLKRKRTDHGRNRHHIDIIRPALCVPFAVRAPRVSESSRNPNLWLSVEDSPTSEPTVTESNATYVVPGGSYVELTVPNQVWGRLASAGTAKLTTIYLPT